MLTDAAAGSYCTGEAGKSATAASSATRLLESARQPTPPEEEEEPKSLAEQHRENLAGKENGHKSRELPNYAKRADPNDDVEIDKARLKRALDEEKKRKAMGEDEAWHSTKKSKTDVTQEELGA